MNRAVPRHTVIAEPGTHHPTADTPLINSSKRGTDMDWTHRATGRSPGKRSSLAAITDIPTDAASSSMKIKASGLAGARRKETICNSARGR